jgi:hypothetical protein
MKKYKVVFFRYPNWTSEIIEAKYINFSDGGDIIFENSFNEFVRIFSSGNWREVELINE